MLCKKSGARKVLMRGKRIIWKKMRRKFTCYKISFCVTFTHGERHLFKSKCVWQEKNIPTYFPVTTLDYVFYIYSASMKSSFGGILSTCELGFKLCKVCCVKFIVLYVISVQVRKFVSPPQ